MLNKTISQPKFYPKKPFGKIVLKSEGSPISITEKGTIIMVPKKEEHDEYGLSYKVGVAFDEDCAFIKELDDCLEELRSVVKTDAVLKSPHNEGTVFFKLTTDTRGAKFKCASNVLIKPSKLSSNLISSGDNVECVVLVGCWIMRKEGEADKAGLTLTLQKLTFDVSSSQKE